MKANPAADGGKGHLLPDQGQGFVELALAGQVHIAHHIDACRASSLAGGLAPAGYGISVGDGLRERAADGMAVRQAKFKVVGNVDGADLFTVAAAGTLVQGHVAGFLPHLGMEISNEPR